MPIRGLDPYLRERKLVTTAPLTSLSGCRLGIDASHYLRTLLSEPDTREPLVASTGGLPLALTTRIENDLRHLERLNIKPVFIFAGLPLSSRPPPKGVDPLDRETQVKNDAWSFYEEGQVERAVLALTTVRGGAWTDHRDVMRLVLRIFRHRFVEYVVAPYSQYGQLAYLLRHPKTYIHAVYSSTEALLFPIDKVITTIDFAGSFTFVEKSRLLSDLAMTPDQLLDLGLLAGCELSRTFPPVVDAFAIKSVIDLVKHYKSGIAACQTWRDNPQVKLVSYGETFMRARLAIKYSLVLTTEGTCVPLPIILQPAQVMTTDVPADLEDIFSMRLPDEVFFQICRGLVSPQLVGWLTSGMLVETSPLADSHDYRRYIKDVITEGHTAPRCTTLALLASCLHPHWMQRRVGSHYYFDAPFAPAIGSAIPFSDPMALSLVEKCTTWVVPGHIVDEELRRQNSSTIDIKLCIGALVEESGRTKRDKSSKTLEKKDEIVANIIWRFLDVRGFVGANHTQTTMGKALHAGCVASRVNDKFQEALYLILELLRAGVVHGQKWANETLSGGPSFGSDEDQASTLLIMRCLSVVPLNFRPQQWAGPLSRELLVFNSFIRSLSKSLRHLFEAVSVHAVLSGDARRSRDDFVDIALSLPFQGEVNTGFGILAKTYLDAATFHFGDTITEDNDAVRQAKKDAMSFVEQSFTSVKSPIAEVERGFRFWDSVMVAIRTISGEQGPNPSFPNLVLQQSVIDQFERADKWLRPMRP